MLYHETRTDHTGADHRTLKKEESRERKEGGYCSWYYLEKYSASNKDNWTQEKVIDSKGRENIQEK